MISQVYPTQISERHRRLINPYDVRRVFTLTSYFPRVKIVARWGYSSTAKVVTLRSTSCDANAGDRVDEKPK